MGGRAREAGAKGKYALSRQRQKQHIKEHPPTLGKKTPVLCSTEIDINKWISRMKHCL